MKKAFGSSSREKLPNFGQVGLDALFEQARRGIRFLETWARHSEQRGSCPLPSVTDEWNIMIAAKSYLKKAEEARAAQDLELCSVNCFLAGAFIERGMAAVDRRKFQSRTKKDEELLKVEAIVRRAYRHFLNERNELPHHVEEYLQASAGAYYTAGVWTFEGCSCTIKDVTFRRYLRRWGIASERAFNAAHGAAAKVAQRKKSVR